MTVTPWRGLSPIRALRHDRLCTWRGSLCIDYVSGLNTQWERVWKSPPGWDLLGGDADSPVPSLSDRGRQAIEPAP